jgi:hypothetical protein
MRRRWTIDKEEWNDLASFCWRRAWLLVGTSDTPEKGCLYASEDCVAVLLAGDELLPVETARVGSRGARVVRGVGSVVVDVRW